MERINDEDLMNVGGGFGGSHLLKSDNVTCSCGSSNWIVKAGGNTVCAKCSSPMPSSAAGSGIGSSPSVNPGPVASGPGVWKA